MKSKLTNNVALFLQSPKGVKKSWIRTITVTILCAVLFITFISLSFIHGPMSKQSQWATVLGKSFYQVVNAPYIEAATWISVAGLCLLGIPFIYLFSVWMIGINEVSKSPRFHLFMWIIGFLLALLALVALILFVRGSIFNINSEYITIPTEDDKTPETSSFIAQILISFSTNNY